jgi:hypothetical protein
LGSYHPLRLSAENIRGILAKFWKQNIGYSFSDLYKYRMIFIPLAVLFIALLVPILLIHYGRKQTKRPIQGKVSRPPGETCRQRLEDLDEKLTNTMLWLFGVALTLIVSTLATQNSIIGIIMATLATAITAALFGYRFYKISNEYSNYNLGFQGERVVGHHLNQLVSEGCRVFHDLQFGKFNIDHVLVCSGGVLCIETKTRRKPKQADGHKVIYDGKSLSYPFGSERHGLDQVERNSKYLRKFIADSSGENVKVQPVLVLPGWFVERKGRGPVHVVSHKELNQIIPSEAQLSPGQIQRISYQIELVSQMNF